MNARVAGRIAVLVAWIAGFVPLQLWLGNHISMAAELALVPIEAAGAWIFGVRIGKAMLQ